MERIIGIMGGTFNPIHLGHIQIAVKAHEQFNIPHILVMPSGQPSSYKDTSVVVDAIHRCAMIELSIKKYPLIHRRRDGGPPSPQSSAKPSGRRSKLTYFSTIKTPHISR